RGERENPLLGAHALPTLRLRSTSKMLATDELPRLTPGNPPGARAAGVAAPQQPPEAWSRERVAALFELPFADLLFRAQNVHREHFDPNRVQISQLVSIKTGGCPENCGYCSQSAQFKTGVKPTKLMTVEEVREAARAAKASGVQRLCLGAAWRSPKERDLESVLEMIQVIKDNGLESCVTLGMVNEGHAG